MTWASEYNDHNPLKQNSQNKLVLFYYYPVGFAIRLVLKPIFSTLAIGSSVVPVFEQLSLKFLNSASSL